jgi:TonB family protein
MTRFNTSHPGVAHQKETTMKTLAKTMMGLTIAMTAAAVVHAEERGTAMSVIAAGAVSTAATGASRPLPAFPVAALRSGERYGRVLIDYDVSADGGVKGARVVSAYPVQVFTRTALGAVENWRHVAGQPGTRTVEFTFHAD